MVTLPSHLPWGTRAAAAAAPALAKGEACTPLVTALVGTPPALPEQQDITLPVWGAGRSWHGQGAPCQSWVCPLPLCQEPHAGQPGSSANTPSMGRGSCKHTCGNSGDREILGIKGRAGGWLSPEGSRVGRKQPRPVLALKEPGQNPPCPAIPGTDPGPGSSAGRENASRGPDGVVACRSPP